MYIVPGQRLRRINAVLGARAQPSEGLDPAALIERARKGTGLQDLGHDSFREPFARLVRALETEAVLSPIGRRIALTRLEGALRNRLMLQADQRRFPALQDQKIERPLFIVGMPRTGTSILFHLLAQDPGHLTPMLWKLDFPSPPPPRDPRAWERRVWQTRFRSLLLRGLLPELRVVHTVDAGLPHECVVMMGHEFASIVYSIPYHVPSYEDWLLDADFRPAYAWHRRFLEQLQFQVTEPRWVLKSPTHLLSLDMLFEAYPDARIVWTHRDPIEAVPSIANLTCTLRALSSEAIDPIAIGPRAAHFWSRAIDRGQAFRAEHPELEDRFLDVRFTDICNDPLAVARRIDQRFDLGVSALGWVRMRRFVQKHPRHEHGKHRYRAETFGVDPASVAARFKHYRETHEFDVTPAAAADASARSSATSG